MKHVWVWILTLTLNLLGFSGGSLCRADGETAGDSAIPLPAPSDFLGLVLPAGYRLTWADGSQDGDTYLLDRRQMGETTFSKLARLKAHSTAYVDSTYAATRSPVYRLRIMRSSKLGKPAFCDSKIKPWTYIRVVAYDALWSDAPTMQDVLDHLNWMQVVSEKQANLNSVLLGDAYGATGSVYGAVSASGPVIINRPEVDTGDVQTYREFFDWVASNYPGQRYVISFWGHGSGAIDSQPQASSANAIGPDLTSDNELTSDETGEAIGYLTEKTSRKVDVFFVCACLTQMIENAYAVRDSVKYMVAGESVVGCGCDPHGLLAAHPEPDAKWLADATVACQPTSSYRKDVVYSAVDISQVAQSAALLDALSEALRTYLAGDASRADLVKDAAGRAQNMSFTPQRHVESAYLDVYDLCAQLKTLGDPGVTAKARAVMNHLSSSLVSSIAIQNDDQGLYTKAHGLSIYHPTPNYPRYSSTYDRLSFARTTHWNEYLKSLFVVGGTSR